jgi:ribonuclease E
VIEEAVGEQIAESIAVVAEPVEAAEVPSEDAPKKRTRRKKAEVAEQPVEVEAVATPEPETTAEPVAEKPKRTRKKKVEAEPVVEVAPEPVAEEAAPAEKPKRTRKKKVDAEVVTADPAPATVSAADNDANGTDESAESKSKRGGWWQRTFGE